MQTFQEKIEKCELLDRYINTMSKGNLYSFTYEQQTYLLDNNIKASNLLTFDEWNNKGARIYKGSKAIRLPNHVLVFDKSQTNFKSNVDEDFPRLNFDKENINQSEFDSLVNYYLFGEYKSLPHTEYGEILAGILNNRFNNTIVETSKFIEEPLEIDLQKVSILSSKLLNSLKQAYNEIKDTNTNDKINFSELINHIYLTKVLGGDENGRNDNSNENESRLSSRESTMGVSAYERQGNTNVTSKTNQQQSGNDLGRSFAQRKEELQYDSRDTIQRTALGRESGSEQQLSPSSERDRTIRGSISTNDNGGSGRIDETDSINNGSRQRRSDNQQEDRGELEIEESDDETSLFKSKQYTQTSLFDDIQSYNAYEQTQEDVLEQKNTIEYVVDKLENDIDKVLLLGSGTEHGKFRIYDLITNHKDISTSEKTKLFAKEHGEYYGWHSPEPLEDSNINGADFSRKGIKISYIDKSELNVKWSEAFKHVKSLIESNKYLNEEEYNQYKKWTISNEFNPLFDKQTITNENDDFVDSSSEELSEDDELLLDVSKGLSVEELKEAGLDNTEAKALNFAANIEIKGDNYHINDNEIGVGTPQERFENNIAAIKVLKELEEKNLPATKEQQDILAKYVGWGGLADFLDENKKPKQYKELSSLISEEEMTSARSSTLSSFYTKPIVIDTIYKGLEKFGFKSGNILEPSCGTGNFFGRLPKEMEKSNLFGVELDSLSARIAKKLYPNANIQHTGFENTEFDDNSFDVAMGNVPFGDFSVMDKRYDKYNFKIHDYFFAKTIDKVRPNGIIALITSKGTMDKLSSKAREYISTRCDLLGSIRLPKEAFKSAAGTEAISDIIFLSKREIPRVKSADWIESNEENFMKIDYFDKYMSKEDIEEYISDLLINKEYSKYNALVQYCHKRIDETDNAYYYKHHENFYQNEIEQGDYEQSETRESAKEKWHEHWYPRWGSIRSNDNYNFHYQGNIELVRWFRDKPNELIKDVAESGKFKAGKTPEERFKLAEDYLRNGDYSIERIFKSNYIDNIVEFLISDAKDRDEKQGQYLQPINNYYATNKDMFIGTPSIETSMYGYDFSLSLKDTNALESELDRCLNNINYEYKEEISKEQGKESASSKVIPANFDIKNYSYGKIDDSIYYRTNSTMELVSEKGDKKYNILNNLLEIRDTYKALVKAQLNDCTDDELKEYQSKLAEAYNSFVKENGRLFKNEKKIKEYYQNDNGFTILTSLEKTDDDTKEFKGLADIFTKRTIHKQETTINKCETAQDALLVSLKTKLGVDFELMEQLTNTSKEELIKELKGQIYIDHKTGYYVPQDEYLSGNVRLKLKEVNQLYDEILELRENEDDRTKKTEYSDKLKYLLENREALEKIQPIDLKPVEIDMPLGANWIPDDVITNFALQVILNNDYYHYNAPQVHRSHISNAWVIENKNKIYDTTYLTEIYGLKDHGHNALDILEKTLNLKREEVAYYVDDGYGNKIRKVDKKKTLIAIDKQDKMKADFQKWLKENPETYQRLANVYNEKFNCYVERKYNPDLINPIGMATIQNGVEFKLYDHQKEAIAKALFGGNTGVFHTVGAGKTNTMICTAMESKRLGLCNKSLFVVPKAIVGQWGKDFITAYPNANILVADSKSFSPANRRKFVSKIATGNYDAIIMSNEQFKYLSLSNDRVCSYIQDDLDRVMAFIKEQKEYSHKSWSVKQAEKVKKTLETRLKKQQEMKKDDFVEFEELGIDKLFIDESHNFKNLQFETTLTRVKGIGSSATSQKSNDLYYKTRYLNEITNNKGIVFATGTPISNYLAEMYTIMRYLQPDTLNELGVNNFDSWVSVFGEIVEEQQISATGTEYENRSMLKRYHNVPELMTAFRQVADIKPKGSINIKLPQEERINITVPRTDSQKAYLDKLMERVDNVKNNKIDPSIDNMLLITNDGRKMALDQRLVDLPVKEDEKVKCDYIVENVYKEYINSNDTNGTQAIFSDLSTPNDNKWNLYQQLKDSLVEKGIPADEIKFVHDCDNDTKRLALFKSVNEGKTRIIIGSTDKLGTGVNTQNKMVAIHHADVPWKPSCIEQREGRAVRQGNENEKVKIYRYITPDTFDAYSWQIIENKATFITQIMTQKNPARSCDDIDEVTLDAAEIKALATGNPLIKERMTLENDIKKLNIKKQEHYESQARIKEDYEVELPRKIDYLSEQISRLKHDLDKYNSQKPKVILTADNKEQYELNITINGKTFTDYKLAGEELQKMSKGIRYPDDKLSLGNKGKVIGNYLGFDIHVGAGDYLGQIEYLIGDKWNFTFTKLEHPASLTNKLIKQLDSLETILQQKEEELKLTQEEYKKNKALLGKEFEQEKELIEKQERLKEIIDSMNKDNKYSSEESLEGLTLYDEKGNIVSNDMPSIDTDDELEEDEENEEERDYER